MNQQVSSSVLKVKPGIVVPGFSMRKDNLSKFTLTTTKTTTKR